MRKHKIAGPVVTATSSDPSMGAAGSVLDRLGFRWLVRRKKILIERVHVLIERFRWAVSGPHAEE
jgi:hypothetical protein